jgi:REP element-mobilizing transposase RayT
MSDHLHLLVHSKLADLSGTIRDFKSYTSKIITEKIVTDSESRRKWMLEYFKKTARQHKRNSEYQFWTHENHSEHIFTDKFVSQKLEYIHMNPVRAGIVRSPEEYLYSSASNYERFETVLEVEILTTKWKTIS